MLWKTETPGARMAAASCLSPEFLVAPETLISPSRGPPGRTRKYRSTHVVRRWYVGLALRERMRPTLRRSCRRAGASRGWRSWPRGSRPSGCTRPGRRRPPGALRRATGGRPGRRPAWRRRTAIGGCAAIFSASAVAADSRSASSTNRLTSPIRCASSASIGLGGEDQFLGLGRPDDPGQPVRAAEVGEHPVLVLGEGQLRASRRRSAGRRPGPAGGRRRGRSPAWRRSSGRGRRPARCRRPGVRRCGSPACPPCPARRSGCRPVAANPSRPRRTGCRRPPRGGARRRSRWRRPAPPRSPPAPGGWRRRPGIRPSLASSSHISIVMALSRSGRLSRSQPTAPTCS